MLAIRNLTTVIRNRGGLDNQILAEALEKIETSAALFGSIAERQKRRARRYSYSLQLY